MQGRTFSHRYLSRLRRVSAAVQQGCGSAAHCAVGVRFRRTRLWEWANAHSRGAETQKLARQGLCPVSLRGTMYLSYIHTPTNVYIYIQRLARKCSLRPHFLASKFITALPCIRRSAAEARLRCTRLRDSRGAEPHTLARQRCAGPRSHPTHVYEFIYRDTV